MRVRISSADDLKKFINNYKGYVGPTANQIGNKIVNSGCVDITQDMYNQIMTQYKKVMIQYNKVVKKEKLDGGFRRERKKGRKSKKRRKSNKRRTKKNQKGGVGEEVIIYSFGFVSLLSIALLVIASPFIIIKDCHDKRKEYLGNLARLERERVEGERAEEEASRQLRHRRSAASRSRSRRRTHVPAILAKGEASNKKPTIEEVEDLILEGITRKSATRSREDEDY